MTGRDLAAWLALLEQRHPKKIDLGLERVAAVARRMELLPVNCPVVTVAGTNGKGTTVAVLDAIARHAGIRALAYTSPHLVRFNERLRVAGTEVGDAAICDAFSAIEAARAEISLSYFEFGVLAALWLARTHRVDLLILEVGLGGRLDATNIVDPTVAVITRIDLDHQEWLGTSREQIALEKAGILRSHGLAIVSDPEPPLSLRERIETLAVDAQWLGRDFGCAEDGAGLRVWLQAGGGVRHEFAAVHPGGLLGQNIAAAVCAAHHLRIPLPHDALADVLSRVQLQGRCQAITLERGSAVLDVSHNPASAAQLARYLRANPVAGWTIGIFTAMADKDIHGILRACADQVDLWIVPALPEVARAADPAQILAILRSLGIVAAEAATSPQEALDRALVQMDATDRLLVFGSFYTVGAVLPALSAAGAKISA